MVAFSTKRTSAATAASLSLTVPLAARLNFFYSFLHFTQDWPLLHHCINFHQKLRIIDISLLKFTQIQDHCIFQFPAEYVMEERCDVYSYSSMQISIRLTSI